MNSSTTVIYNGPVKQLKNCLQKHINANFIEFDALANSKLTIFQHSPLRPVAERAKNRRLASSRQTSKGWTDLA
jgi:hypothetical protein